MNPALALTANALSLLTCGTLTYHAPHPDGHDNRAIAAVALLEQGDVHRTEEAGVYLVKSRRIKRKDNGEPVYYRVLVDGDDLHCQCMDDYYRGGDPRPKETIICVHTIAAALLAALDATEVQEAQG